MRSGFESRNFFSCLKKNTCSDFGYSIELKFERQTKNAKINSRRGSHSRMNSNSLSDSPPGLQTRPKLLSAGELRQLYGHDYFSGISSGYPDCGYAGAHPDWGPWLDLIRLIQPHGKLVDLGCAFGYLVREARTRGYQASGLDISPYALSREPAITGLIEGDLQVLPLRSSSADVVVLFDVLEHLTEPRHTLAEVVRVLTPEGLIVGTTPDPIFFQTEESTHFFERPPSYWLDRLRKHGLEVCFRFSEEDYNFQFVASPRGSRLCSALRLFQHDYFSTEPDFLETTGPAVAVPRSGWGGLSDKRRSIRDRASVYLLNPTPSPLRCIVSFRLLNPGRCTTLQVGFNSLVLGEWVLTPEQPAEQQLRLPPIQVPGGGHHLWFELQPGARGVKIGVLEIESAEGSAEELVLSLPFDLFQRYRLAGQICDLLEPARVLDVGGYLGDEGGHLATSRDFLCPGRKADRDIRSTDLRQGDWPAHQPALAWAQPFADDSFDLVLSLDVLEHLAEEDRAGFLAELDRLSRSWILLSAPFAGTAVEAAEELLRNGLLSAQRFLKEHQQLGLPELEGVRRHYQSKGYSVEVIPNGYLPRWKAMQVLTCLYFGHRDQVSFQSFNRLYNRLLFPRDQREPSYRRHVLVSKRALEVETSSRLAALHAESEAGLDPDLEVLGHPDFVRLNQRILDRLEHFYGCLTDTQFLFGEREKLIHLLENDLEKARLAVKDLRYRTPLFKLLVKRLRRRLNAFRKRTEPASLE